MKYVAENVPLKKKTRATSGNQANEATFEELFCRFRLFLAAETTAEYRREKFYEKNKGASAPTELSDK